MKHLSQVIGPRPSASGKEAEAAAYVKARLEEFGCEAEIEHAPAMRTYSWLHVLHYSMFIAAWALMNAAPWVSVALCVAGCVSYALDVCARAGLSVFFPKAKATNVVAYKMSKKPMLAKVVISAHTDSSRSAMFFHPKMVKGFRQTFVLTVVAMLATLAAAAVYAAGYKLFYLWVAAGVLNVQNAVALLMLLDRELRGRHTPGAADNASGVAAMLGVAEALADRQLERVELEFVGTGAEESGLFGMIHYLETHWHNPERTIFINIDHVGTGEISVTTREGMLLRKDSDIQAVEWAKEFKLPSTGAPARMKDFRTMLTDGYAAQVRGFRSVSIMAFNPDETLANWHWHTDVAEHISEDNLRDAAALAVHIIQRAEREAEEENRSHS